LICNYIYSINDNIYENNNDYYEKNLMPKFTAGMCAVSRGFLLAVLCAGITAFGLNPHPVLAGNGTAVDIPNSNTIPSLDGVCNPSEYADATVITITVGANHTFPVYMKHTADNAYFCFGDSTGLPLPNGGASSVTVYIDINNDGVTANNNSDDFGIWVPYATTDAPFAHYWGTTAYDGADPGGWLAVKHQIGGGSPFWQAEFQISRQTMGGWNHKVGLALFYHWWSAPSDDYSWPAQGIWANPAVWGTGNLTTANVTVGLSATIPVLDGSCGTEYTDASQVSFTAPAGLVTGYLKHSATDLYVCLTNLTVPALGQQDSPNAALYLNRSGGAGNAPDSGDVLLTITYNGTVQVNTGDGAGFTGPDPGGTQVALSKYPGGWDAEFRISSATIGKWLPRTIGLTLAEENITGPGDDHGWPDGYSRIVPNTWGQASLIQIGNSNYLPLLSR
jgi:hypothetical protein